MGRGTSRANQISALGLPQYFWPDDDKVIQE